MRCVCVRPVDHVGHCGIWRLEKIVEAARRVGAGRRLDV